MTKQTSLNGTTALFLSCLAAAAHAASTWSGAGDDDLWSNATNWVENAAPASPAALTFGGSTRLTPTNDLVDVTVNSITFAAGAGAFALSGNPVTLGGNVSVALGGSVTNDQTIRFPISLSASPALLAGPVGNINATIKGALVLNGPISGPFGLTTSGRNYVQLNGTNTYSGDTTVTSSSGDIYISVGSDSAFGTGRVKFGAAAGAPQLWAVASGADRTVTNDADILTGLFIGHNATVNGKAPGSLTLSGSLRVQASSAFYVNASYLTLSGAVSGGNSAANNFELRAGKLNLWGNNTFTNTLIITNPGYGPARTLNINSDASLGHTNNGVRLNTSATVQLPASTNVVLAPSRMINITSNFVATFDIPSGASLTLNGPVTNSGAVAKSNAGTLVLAGANSYGGGTKIYGGTLSTTDDASLGALPATPQTNLTFVSSGTLGAGANHALAANRMVAISPNVTASLNPQAYTQTINGVVSGGPGSWLTKTGEGTVALDPGADKTNTVWSLRTQAGTLQFVSGTHLVVSNTVWNQYKVYDILHINGGTLLVGGGLLMTTGDGYATVQNGTLLVTNGTANLNSVQELLNAYAGTGNTTVSGSGVLDLKVLRITQSGTPHDQNVVNVNTGGTIRLNYFNIDTGQIAPYGTVNLNGGTLVAKSASDHFIGYNVDKWVTNVFFYVRAGGAVFDSDGYDIVAQLPLLSGAASDGGLTKRGAGTLTLANTNTYNGLTLIEAGTLKLNALNTLGSAGSLWVASNAVFDVNGKVQTLAGLAGSGLVTNNGSLSVTLGVAPGTTNTIGTLTLASAPAALNGIFLAEVAADGACDRLHVQGDLDLTGLDLTLQNPEALSKNQRYVIASYAGSLAGPFHTAPLPDRWHVAYNAAAREVFLRYDFGSLIMLQ